MPTYSCELVWATVRRYKTDELIFGTLWRLPFSAWRISTPPRFFGEIRKFATVAD